MSVSSLSNLLNSYSSYSSQLKEAETSAKNKEDKVTKQDIEKIVSSQTQSRQNLINAFVQANSKKEDSAVYSLYDSFNQLALMNTNSYSKLVKSYYASLQNNAASNAQSIKVAGNSARDLVKAANTLKRSSLFDMKNFEVKGENGEVTFEKDYDREAIASAVKGFVKEYNSTLDAIADTDDVKTLQKGVTMVGMTASVSGSLGRVGITVGENNQLSVDEEKLANADISYLKSLFSGEGSYAARIAQKASMVANNASVSGYNASGSYNYTMQTVGVVNLQT